MNPKRSNPVPRPSRRDRQRLRRGLALNSGLPSRIEDLESRSLMAVLTWTGAAEVMNSSFNGFTSDCGGTTNWQGNVVPAAGDTLIFPQGADYIGTIVNDTAADTAYTLQFSGEGYDLTGNDIDLNGLTDSTTPVSMTGNTIEAGLALSTDQTIEVTHLGETLDIKGAISSSDSNSLTKTGSGVLAYTGCSVNTYGATYVQDGGLLLNRMIAGGSIPGDLTVGDGEGLAGSAGVDVGPSATVAQFATLSAITVNSDGLLSFHSSLNESLGDLSINDGTVSLLNVSSTSGISVLTTTIDGSSSQMTSNGGRLTLGGTFAVTSGSPEISADIALNDDARVIAVSSEASLTLSGILSPGTAETGGIEAVGPGTLSLTGANSYTGTTKVDDGTLALAHVGSPTIQGPLVIGDGIGAANSAVVTSPGGQIGSGQSLSINSDGKFQILDGGSEDLGNLTMTEGTVEVGSLTSAELTIGSLTLGGTGSSITGSGTLSLGGAVSVTGGSWTIGTNVALNHNSRLISIDPEAALTISGVASAGTAGDGGIEKAGSGSLTLTGTNTYTGTTLVDDGTLALDDTDGAAIQGPLVIGDGIGASLSAVVTTIGDQLAGTPDVTVYGDGLFSFLSAASETLGGLMISGGEVDLGAGGEASIASTAITLDGTGSAILGSGTVILNGAVTVESGSTSIAPAVSLNDNARSISVASGAGLTISGVIAPGTAAMGGIKKAGDGTLTISGTNTYTGTTEVDDGTLALANSIGASIAGPLVIGDGIGAPDSAVVTTLGDQLAGSPAVTVNSDGLFLFDSKASEVVGALLIQGGTVDLTSDPSDSITPTSLTFGTGGGQILGGGPTYLSSDLNVSAGAVTISAGLVLNDDARVVSVSPGATLSVSGVISAGTAISGGIEKTGGGTLILSSSNTFTGDVLVDDGTLVLDSETGSSVLGDLVVGDGLGGYESAVVTSTGGQIGDPPTLTVNSDGFFEVLPGATETFGDVTVHNGVIQVDSGANLSFPTGTLDLYGGTITGAGSINPGLVINSYATGGLASITVSTINQTYNQAVDYNVEYDGPGYAQLTVTSTIYGVGLTKTGEGNLSLDGTSYYYGTTDILEGSVYVDGSIASSYVLLDGGGLLGTGQVGQVGSEGEGGYLHPGDDLGTLSSYSVSLDPTIDFAVDLRSPRRGSSASSRWPGRSSSTTPPSTCTSPRRPRSGQPSR